MTVIKKFLYIKDIKVKTRQRRPVNLDKVKQQALSMKNGESLPPVDVDRNNVLIAGYHRLLAHKQIKRLQIEAKVHTFTYDSVEGKDLEFAENHNREELSSEDRDRGLRAFAERHPDMTKQQIADKWGYTVYVVGKATKNPNITRSRTSNSCSKTDDINEIVKGSVVYDTELEEPVDDAVLDADAEAEAEAEEQYIRKAAKQKSSIPDNSSYKDSVAYKINLDICTSERLKDIIKYHQQETGSTYTPERLIRFILLKLTTDYSDLSDEEDDGDAVKVYIRNLARRVD